MKNILFVESEMNFRKIGFPFEGLSNKYNLIFDGTNKSKKKEKYFSEFCLVISCLYHSPLSNFIIMKAKKIGIPTLLVSDGIFEWSNAFYNPFTKRLKINLYHPVIHDYFLCIGNEEKKYFQSKGINTEVYLPERILKVDDEKIGLPKNKKVLITTANTAYFNEDERMRLTNLITGITNILDRENIEYIYRVYDSSLVQQLNINKNNNYIEGSFKSVLKYVSIVITTPSSIVLESMFHKRAVGQLIYRDTPLFLQSGWNLSFSCDLKDSIKSMLILDPDRMEFQQHEVLKYIPLKKVEESIDEMITSSKLKEIEFVENSLYNLVNSKLNFNFEHLARKIYNFLNNTKVKAVLRKIKLRVGQSTKD